ncbi:ribonuclease P protein component [Georgenia ruanii]|uniref:Ribonuclease P protein component n=1 Tax=Georgenia ruanii TaxID=348442 RepID=A0A7J9V0J1_9MICO|nr:ribonuclease P protein component [Georgenia ruanii]MPV89484.1 ribonuclease P protein component [Georgenia ruanii]
MLPARYRMRRSDEFSDAVRHGVRSGARRLVVHLRLTEDEADQGEPSLVGFIVPKSVGTAVHRNRVKRRLRALVADRLSAVPAGARLVVRALPPADGAGFAALEADLDGALAGALAGAHRKARRAAAARERP